jgi:DNA-binding CsgD family transcriptional regulator
VTAGRDPYRTLTATAVLVVAAIAAVVSFVHIESLAARYGQPLLAAWLLPVSIDGTVAVSSLVMLRAARAQVSAPGLARGMLLLAVGATLACNVGYGLPHGWPGALLSGWPAVAFIGCAEVAISMSRRHAATGHQPAATLATLATPSLDGHQAPGQSRRAARPSAAASQATILAAVASDRATSTNAELAQQLGVSPRTVRRYRARLASAGSS